MGNHGSTAKRTASAEPLSATGVNRIGNARGKKGRNFAPGSGPKAFDKLCRTSELDFIH